MPLYEYKCRNCRNEFEELVSININESVSCPACGAKDTEKKLSAFAADVSSGPSTNDSCSSCCSSGMCGL